MYSPSRVADYILSKYKDKNITPMKLIKLVYIAHGWYLGLTKKPLINEAPQAWKYGPVIPTLYHSYRTYGNSSIEKVFTSPVSLDNDTDEKFIDKIIEVYGDFSALQLSAKTHQFGTPWSKVWNNVKDGNYFSLDIPEDDILEYYETLYLKNKALRPA